MNRERFSPLSDTARFKKLLENLVTLVELSLFHCPSRVYDFCRRVLLLLLLLPSLSPRFTRGVNKQSPWLRLITGSPGTRLSYSASFPPSCTPFRREPLSKFNNSYLPAGVVYLSLSLPLFRVSLERGGEAKKISTHHENGGILR